MRSDRREPCSSQGSHAVRDHRRGLFLGRFTNRPNLLQYECTGCECSVAQELLAWAKVKGTSGVREWCRQTKGWDSEAERGTGMHVIKRFPMRWPHMNQFSPTTLA